MKPNTFASFLIFLLHGIMMACTKKFETGTFLGITFTIVIFTSALYYYYLGLIPTSLLLKPNSVPKWGKKASWVLICSQFVGFYLLWDALKLPEIYWYSIDICFLNITYLIWGHINKDNFINNETKKWIRGFDIAGFILAVFHMLLIFFYFPPEIIKSDWGAQKAMILFAISVLIILQSLGGIIMAAILIKHNPIKMLDMD